MLWETSPTFLPAEVKEILRKAEEKAAEEKKAAEKKYADENPVKHFAG